MQTIFVTASLPMTIRNLVRTGVLDIVSREYRVILLAPFAADRSFVEEFRGRNLVTAKLPFDETLVASFARRLFHIASQRRFLKTHQIDTLFFKEEFLRRTRFRYYLLRSLVDWMNRGRLVERMGRLIWENCWDRARAYHELFERYKPVAVVSTHPYLETEWPLLRYARNRGLPLVGVIHSWDNVTSRGELPFRFDEVIVWSELMKKNLLRFHPWLQDEDVVVCGAPQYDLFLDKTLIEPREKFFSLHGIDPRRQLVLFAGSDPTLFPDQMEVARLILQANRKARLSCPIQLWIRSYGNSGVGVASSLAEYSQDLIYEQAPSEFWGRFRLEERWTGKEKDFRHYINLIYHSAVVVCLASTVTLDAAVLDRPIINIGFDGERAVGFMSSIRRFYFGFSHYQWVVRSGAIRLAMDPEELITYLNEYLEDPALDREARRRFVADIIGPVDGKARQRLASGILNAVRDLVSEK